MSANIKKESTESRQEILECSLDKYCAKELFEVSFLNALTDKDEEFVRNLINHGKDVELKSNIAFITQEDVLNLLSVDITKNFDFPPDLMPLLINIRSYFAKYPNNVSVQLIARLAKMKLIQVMYHHLAEKVRRDRKKVIFQNELTHLCTNVKRTSIPTQKQEDFTDIKISKLDLEDDSLINQVYFYVFEGFSDSLVIKELINLQVPISSLIRVSKLSNKEDYNSFWRNIDFTTNQSEYLEGVVFLKYTPKITLHNFTYTDYKQRFEELKDVIQSVINLKREHMLYLRNLNVSSLTKTTFNNNWMNYSILLDDVPEELISIPIILKHIIDYVVSPKKSVKKNEEHNPQCPFKCHFLDQKKKQEISYQKRFFKIKKGDKIGLISKTYNNVGFLIKEHYLMLKTQPILQFIKETPLEIDDLLHTHNVGVFNEKNNINGLNHFITLLNLKVKQGENVYTNGNILSYQWGEYLSKNILLQRIQQCDSLFNNKIFFYCEATDVFCLMYENKMDFRGFNTTQYDEFLRTPVCFRDFEKYVFHKDRQLIDEKVMSRLRYTKLSECNIFKNIREREKDLTYKDLLDLNPNCYVKTINETDNLRELLDELKEYPKNNEIDSYCKKYFGKTLYSYDLGQKRINLTGQENEFFSLDGVKVKVDTTRFCTQDFQLKSSISFGPDALYLHHSVEPFNFRVLLNSEIIIFFKKPFIESTESSKLNFIKKSTFSELNNSSKQNKSTNQFNPILDKNIVSEISKKEKKEGIEMVKNKEIIYVNDMDYGRKLNVKCGEISKLCKPHTRKTVIKTFKTSICYKVHKIYKDFKYISKKRKEYVTNCLDILRRILYERIVPLKKNKCIKSNSKLINEIYDVKITLPNGSTVSAHPSLTPFMNIKQIPSKTDLKNTGELYRVTTSNGCILAAKSNGNYEIYQAGGTQVNFINETSRKTQNNLVKVRRKMRSIFKHEMENCDNFISRRSHLISQKIQNMEDNVLESLRSIFTPGFPFHKIIVINPNGTEVHLYSNKVVTRKRFELHHPRNPLYANEFGQRADGFSYTLTEHKMDVKFPDGTNIISSWIESVSNKDNPIDWMSVNYNRVYSSVNYLPVVLNSDHQTTKIIIGDKKELVLTPLGAQFFSKNVNLKISSKVIKFKKICGSCGAECKGRINIQPLYNGEDLQGDFINLRDSYDKKFSCTFSGQCRINSDFISGKLNKFECCHFKSKNYQRIFLIERDLNGKLLFEHGTINKILKNSTIFTLVKPSWTNFNNEKEVTFVKILKDEYEGYESKFYPKYRDIKSEIYEFKKPVYQISRIFSKILFDDDLNWACKGLEYLLKNNKVNSIFIKTKKHLQDLYFKNEREKDNDRYQLQFLKRRRSISLFKIKTMNYLSKQHVFSTESCRRIPSYFDSQLFANS